MRKILFAAIAVCSLYSINCGAQIQKSDPKKEEKPKLVTLDDGGDINIDSSPVAAVTEEADPNKIYNAGSLQVSPEFPGGIETFYAYIDNKIDKNKLDRPAIGVYKGYFTFIIEKDGSLTDVTMLRDPGYNIGPEVLKVLKGMTQKWKPGIQNGIPVRTRYHLPVTIKL